MSSLLPDYPWQVTGSDLLEWKGEHYAVVVDYFSCYPEAIKMTTTTFTAVITAPTNTFFRHDIPEMLKSDNDPQYASEEFAALAKSYGFKLVTSSARYPQSNGQAESTVQTVKKSSRCQVTSIWLYSVTEKPLCLGAASAQRNC